MRDNKTNTKKDADTKQNTETDAGPQLVTDCPYSYSEDHAERLQFLSISFN